MKKILLTGLVLAVAGVFGVSGSASCAGKFTIGLEESYIFEREMEIPVGTFPSDVDANMELNDLGRTVLRVGYQVFKNLNIYTKLGVTNDGGGFEMTATGPWVDYPVPGESGTVTEKMEYEADSAFVWALGFKLVFPLQNRWMIGIDAQYLTHENDYSGEMAVRFYDDAGVLMPAYSIDDFTNDAGSSTITEWHVAPFVAKDFGRVVPYLGFKYSELEINPDNEDSFSAEENIGIFAGANFKLTDRFYLNLEGRFIDETAASLAAMFTF